MIVSPYPLRFPQAKLENIQEQLVAGLLLLTLAAVAIGSSSQAIAQTADVTVPAEYGKLIRAPQALGVLGPDLFGDKVNIYNGALEFIQNDLSIPGNSSLPVAVGRRTTVGVEGNHGTGLFKNWDLEIPRIYGSFSELYGWKSVDASGQASSLRCTNFGAPPPVFKPNTDFKYRPSEYWHGNMLYVPGQGDQEILKRNENSAVQWPTDGVATPLVTRNFWVVRCLGGLASTDGTTLPNDNGEGFLAISPDGTQYRFDWLASRETGGLFKIVGKDTRFSLRRREVAIFPTLVTDRFGNTVRYIYDRTDKWKLLEIRGTDGAGNTDRVITFQYLPGTHHISSVTDGLRTWQYAYGTDVHGWAVLSTVTLPDQSVWQLGGMGARNGDPGLVSLAMTFSERPEEWYPDMSCDAFPPEVMNGPASGMMVHPSGAVGTFTLWPVRHARNGIPRNCYGDHQFSPPRAYYPQYFDVYALTNKTITGPGLAPLTWTTAYDTFNPGWIDCTACSEAYNIVSVTDPAGAVTRYSFGSTFNVNEGMLQRVDIGWNGTSAVRSTTTRYNQSFTQPVGFSDQDRGDAKLNARIVPQDLRAVLQEDTTFTWQVPASSDFDSYGRALRTVLSSSLGPSRTMLTEYSDHLSKWILNRIAKVTEASTGKVEVANQFNGTSGNLESVARFGKIFQRVDYHPDGTLASKADGLNPATTFSNYKRGVARLVSYADGTSESGEVNDYGAVTTRTDQNGSLIRYGYDAIGRLNQVDYPAEPERAWNATTVTYSQIGSAEHDLPAGHWRQDVKTGNGQTSTYYDALWRPVLTSQMDLADALNSAEFVLSRYDFSGRQTFVSYPQRSYSATPLGKVTTYDVLGRPLTVLADSELGSLTQRFDYLSGFQKRHTDARNNTTLTTYQVFDQPSEDAIATVAAPHNVDLRIDRDIFGKPRSIARSGGGVSVTRKYVYDSNELLCKTIEPETGATIQAYDAAGNLSWRASGLTLLSTSSCDQANVPAAQKISFGYDVLNQLKTTTYGDNSPAIARTYTADGLLKTISSDGALWTYEYNKRQLNWKETLAYGGRTYTIERAFDANGSLTRLTYPIDNLTLYYSPNALGKATQVGSFAQGIKYHPNGAVKEFTYGNGIRHELEQNARGLPLRTRDAVSETYVYDPNGNPEQIVDHLRGGASRTMTYDGLNRLKTAYSPDLWGSATYGYDAIDNLTSTTISNGSNARSLSHVFNAATNLLDNVSGGPSGFNFGYGYDVRGNITRRGAQRYEFDLANRMRRAVGRGTYAYDGHGRRVSTVGNDQTNTVQIYSQAGQLLYSGPPAGGGIKYVYLNRHQIAEVK